MIGAVLKLIIFTSMVNRIINTSRNERVAQQVYDTYLQMFDVCTLRHTAHIETIVQFLSYSVQKVRCDGLHSRSNSILQIRYAHGLWWHKHFVLHVTSNSVHHICEYNQLQNRSNRFDTPGILVSKLQLYSVNVKANHGLNHTSLTDV